MLSAAGLRDWRFKGYGPAVMFYLCYLQSVGKRAHVGNISSYQNAIGAKNQIVRFRDKREFLRLDWYPQNAVNLLFIENILREIATYYFFILKNSTNGRIVVFEWLEMLMIMVQKVARFESGFGQPATGNLST